MTIKITEADAPTPEAFRNAMRNFAGNVSIITVGSGIDRSGLVATSTVSLSVDPPLMLVCVNRSSSSWPFFERYRHFAVNSIGPGQRLIADRFTGVNGIKGADRFALGTWRSGPTGAPLLVGATVSMDCDIEDMIEKGTHTIMIGRVRSVTICEAQEALVYWQGGYKSLEAAAPL